jgi:hypothetical protein
MEPAPAAAGCERRPPLLPSCAPQTLPNVNGNTQQLTWGLSLALAPFQFDIKFTRVAWDPTLALAVSCWAGPGLLDARSVQALTQGQGQSAIASSSSS